MIDQELSQTIAEDLIALFPEAAIPRTEFVKIARDMIEEQKISDADWAWTKVRQSEKEFHRLRNLAKIKGYAPFICLSKRMFEKLKHTFGAEYMTMFADQLKDPEDIHARWAYRFAYVARQIGFDQCQAQGTNVYKFVTRHPLWKELEETWYAAFSEWISEDPPGWRKRPTSENTEPLESKTENDSLENTNLEDETVIGSHMEASPI